MPFAVGKARERINHLTYDFNGQKLKIKYNAGEKYAELQEEINAQEVDEEETLKDARLRISSQLCKIIESWDAQDESGNSIPLEAESVASLGLPIEFYSGLSQAIGTDVAGGGQAGKGR